MPPHYLTSPTYCHPFFDLVKTEDLVKELQQSRDLTLALFDSIPPGKEDYAYAEGKWTIKEVLRHIMDCERVYAYRAFRFSRLDGTELAGFDENDYIEKARGLSAPLKDLLEEYLSLRNSTIALFKPMTDEMLDFQGRANGVGFTARGLGFMAVGHNLHHCNVVRERYL